jgi:hypothetical protein
VERPAGTGSGGSCRVEARAARGSRPSVAKSRALPALARGPGSQVVPDGASPVFTRVFPQTVKPALKIMAVTAAVIRCAAQETNQIQNL